MFLIYKESLETINTNNFDSISVLEKYKYGYIKEYLVVIKKNANNYSGEVTEWIHSGPKIFSLKSKDSYFTIKKFSDKKEAEIFYKKLQTALINGDTVFEVEDEIK